jgi:hypothetical protein
MIVGMVLQEAAAGKQIGPSSLQGIQEGYYLAEQVHGVARTLKKATILVAFAE